MKILIGVLLALGLPVVILGGLRLWHRLTAGPRRCWTCQYFDHDLGQNALHGHSPFWAAAQYISPAQMARGDGVTSPLAYPVNARWAEFGACLHADRRDADGEPVVQWGGDVCERHQFVPLRDLLHRKTRESESRHGAR